MDLKEEQRTAIKFCFRLGKSATETHTMLLDAYDEEAMSRSRTFEWFSRFAAGGDTIKDNPRSGRPSTSTQPEQVEAVRELLLQDRRIGLKAIAEEVGISYGSVRHIVPN